MADIAQAFLRLRADGTGFKEEADATVKKSTAGLKAKVPLAVDDKEATVVVKRMKDQLTELSAKTYTAGLGLKDKDAQLRLQRFAVKLYDLGRKVADPELKLRGVAKAETELLALGHQFDKLNGKTAEVKVETGKLGSTLSKLTPAWTGFLAAGLALGPALLPVLGAVTAGAVGMGAAIAGAGSAVGVFAVAAKGNLTEMQKALTKVKAAELAANTALAVSAKNRTKAQDAAIVKARQLSAAFTKTYGPEADAIKKLQGAWEKFVTQPIVTSTLAKGMQLITAILPHLVPLLRLGGNAAQAFLGALAGFTVGGGLDRLVAGLVKIGRLSLTGFLAVLHNLAVAFGALSGGAGRFAAGAVSGLVKLSAAFASWATNKGPGALAGLMATVRKLGPGVLALITSLAATVPNLARGLFPLAPLSLALSTALAGIIAHVPPGAVTAIATAFLAVWSAIKLITIATKVWEGVQIVMNAILTANPIGIVVVALAALTAGIILAYTHSATFRKIVQATFGWIKDHWPLLLSIIAGPIGIAAALIIKHWHGIWAGIQAVWGWIKGHWPLLLTILTGPVGLAAAFIIRHWAAIQAGASAVIGWIRGHWQLLLGILTGPVGAAVAFIIRHWGQVVTGAQGVLNFFRGAWQNLEHLLEKPFKSALGVIRGIWKTILGFIHGITGFLGGGGTVPGGRGHGMGGGSTGANARLAQRMVPQWSSGANWAAWNYVAMRESGWSQYAENATSGAYGIPQALPPTKLPFAGQKAGGSQPGPQIGWMARYMAGRYGGPIGAAAHERTFNWYHDGGPITEAISGIGLSGRRYGFEAGEWVTSRRDAGRGGGWHDEAALGLLEELIGAVYASAGLTGEAMGAALRGGARRASYQALYGTS